MPRLRSKPVRRRRPVASSAVSNTLASTGWVGRDATARLTSCRAAFSSDWEQTSFMGSTSRPCVLKAPHGFTGWGDVQRPKPATGPDPSNGFDVFLNPNQTAVVGAGETVESMVNPCSDKRDGFHRVGEWRCGDAENTSICTGSTAWGKVSKLGEVELAAVFHRFFTLF